MSDTDIQFGFAMWALLSLFCGVALFVYTLAVIGIAWSFYDKGYGVFESVKKAMEELK